MSSLESFYKDYLGRPTPLYHAKTLSNYFGANIYLKREDLNHTGSMQINNAFEQLFKAKTQGFAKVYLKTQNRDFAIACAASCARLEMQLHIENESFDALSRFRLNLYGIKKLASEEIDESYYVVDKGYFSSIIAQELIDQAKNMDALIMVSENYEEAAVVFEPFMPHTRCVAVGTLASRKAPFEYVAMEQNKTLRAFGLIAQSEGIIVSFQSAMAINYLLENKPKKNDDIVIILGENGDKDMEEAFKQISF